VGGRGGTRQNAGGGGHHGRKRRKKNKIRGHPEKKKGVVRKKTRNKTEKAQSPGCIMHIGVGVGGAKFKNGDCEKTKTANQWQKLVVDFSTR